MQKLAQKRSESFAQLLRDVEGRGEALLQLQELRTVEFANTRKYTCLGSASGVVFGLMFFLPAVKISLDQIFPITLGEELVMSICLGGVTLISFGRAIFAAFSSSLLDNQIRILQLADYIDERDRL